MPRTHRTDFVLHPLLLLVPILTVELLVILAIPAFGIGETAVARAYTEMFGSVAPALRHFQKIGENAQAVMLCIALSPIFLVPKVVSWVRWLRSDRVRIYRYLVIAPDAREVPKGTMDFVTDPMRSDAENRAAREQMRISTTRAVLVSLGTVILAFGVGLFWPYVVSGYDTFRGKPVDVWEAAVVQGGWRLWLSWSVYQMNLSAGLLAIAYCVLAEYGRMFSKKLHRA